MTKPTLVINNNPPALTLEDWLGREIAEPDNLLGELLTTTSRALIVGPTGLGKTMFGIAIAIAIASNAGFRSL